MLFIGSGGNWLCGFEMYLQFFSSQINSKRLSFFKDPLFWFTLRVLPDGIQQIQILRQNISKLINTAILHDKNEANVTSYRGLA